METIERLHVDLGDRGYDILVGPQLIERSGREMLPLMRRRHAVVVSDEIVAGHYLASLRDSLSEAGIAHHYVLLPPGEETKDLAHFGKLAEDILALGIERGTMLVALGGGVVGDVTGFAAATLLRGIDFVQIPTTLLAQVDSSVGGKTGINTRHGKNLIGAFYQPILVIADTALLDTLPQRDFRAGYAEVAKFGLLGDAGFFAWLEANWADIFAGGSSSGSSAREHAIAIACRGKAGVVARDERETGERALLNLGHTFGHAFEAAAGFSDRLLHGEAISIGIACAFEFSAQLGLLPQAEADRAVRHLAVVGLPTHIREMPAVATNVDALMELIAQDKKVKRGKLTFILVRGIGRAFVADDIDPAQVRAF